MHARLAGSAERAPQVVHRPLKRGPPAPQEVEAARPQVLARWHTRVGSNVRVGENRAPPGQPVQVRRAYPLVAVAAEVIPPQGIEDDDDSVHALALLLYHTLCNSRRVLVRCWRWPGSSLRQCPHYAD